MKKSYTYVHAHFSATEVSRNISLSSNLPFALDFFVLSAAGEIDLPAISVVDVSLALHSHLVVGVSGSPSSGAWSGEFELASSLLDSGLSIVFPGVFPLSFERDLL